MKTSERIRILGGLSRRWLDRRYRFRRLAVRRLVHKSGFAPAAAEAMLDALFRELTPPRLERLVRVEAGSSGRLDRARGPRRITHVLAGNVPNPGVMSVIFGLLVRAENLVKPSSRDEGIVDLYVRSLKKASPALAASCRILAPNDRAALKRAVASSDLVAAYGSDETVEAVRAMTAPGTRFEGYGHRVSFAIVAAEAQTRAVARRTALDVWMMDKRGCLSPALIFVEESGRAGEFCYRLCRELDRLESREGRAPADPGRAASIRRTQQEARLDRGHFMPTDRRRYFTRILPLKQTAWSEAPGADIRPFRSPAQVYRVLRPFSRSLQACALECAPRRRAAIAKKLAALGFNRVCRAGQLQFPPITWPHDGRPNFAGWLRGQAPSNVSPN